MRYPFRSEGTHRPDFQGPMTGSTKSLWVLLGIVFVLFLPLSLSGEFIWDDPKLVELNEWTSSWSNLGRMFTEDLWASTPLGAGEFFYYRPLMLVSLTVDHSLGFGATGHHLHSLFWHLVCVSLVFRLCRECSSSTWAVFAGTSLFALHPLQTEILAHIAARNDAMATAGILGALILLLEKTPSKASLWGAASLMGLAVFSKETAYLAPLMLWGMDRARFSQAENLKRYAAVILPLGLALGLRLTLGGGGFPHPSSWSESIMGLLEGSGFYLSALVYPWNLTPTVSTSEMSLFWPLSLLGLAGLAMLFRLGKAWGRWGLFLAFLGFLPAVPGLILTENTGFRYLYLPLVGLSIALTSVLDRRPSRAFLMLPVVWFGCTSAQLSHWSNDRALWTHAYEVAPGLQSACGTFKSFETLARETPLGEYRDQLYKDAEPWLARALEAPTNAYCCLSASRWMWERNQNEWMLTRPEPAIYWGSIALENGCPKSAELLVPLAISNALQGKWSTAEAQLAGLNRDPFGLRDVVLSAAALKRSNRRDFERIAGPEIANQDALEQRALLLISASDSNTALREE